MTNSSSSAPHLLGWPFTAMPARARLGVLGLALIALAVAVFVGSRSYPQSKPAEGSELERRIAEVMHDPTVASWDSAIVGDLLIERFYVLDLVSGDRYVADFLKGRIDGVEVVRREDQPDADVLLLNSRDMRRDKAFYGAYFRGVVHPDGDLDAFYLGVITPTGDRDAFPVNYNGELPAQRFPFFEGEDTDIYSFLLRQNFKAITAPRGIGLGGYTYVLNTSDNFPLFKNEYRLDKTIFLSELLIVDTTSRPNKAKYFSLLEQYPRAPGP